MKSQKQKIFSKGDKVILKQFMGKKERPSKLNASEDYWKLIGKTGNVISESGKIHPAFPDKGERVLVQFIDSEMSSLGLECHNPTGNSLWIFVTDLDLL